MKKTVMLISLLLASNSAIPAESAHWAYSGSEGPKHWATLSPDNISCSGKNQSPINLSGYVEAELSPIQFSYITAGNEILNNGHTVQVNYEEGSYISLDGETFNLLQFHFHAPSENHINGKSFPLEAHFVHADTNGNLAVVAVMFEEGAENAALTDAWDIIPKHAGDKNILTKKVSAEAILPAKRDYYRFNGSLTTPPCSEGVRWLVMKDSETASKQQIDAFKQVLHEPNNRPLQSINARTILQ